MNASWRSIGSFLTGPWPSALVVFFFAYASTQEVVRHGPWRSGEVFNWDIEGYHHYLPAFFIHHDLRDLSYLDKVDAKLHPSGEQVRVGVHEDRHTGYDVIKYPMGTALFQLPFFLVAHVWTKATGSYPADGYSLPYQWSVTLSTVLFVSLGLWLLRGFLRKQVSDRDTTIALATIAFGTNLFFYSSINAGMSHGYLFFLFAAVLVLTDRWYRDPRATTAMWLGAVLGLTVIVRPVDGLVFLVPLLWMHNTGSGWRSTIAALRERPRHLLMALGAMILIVSPQLAYWHYTTGHMLHYSYGEEGFDFSDPHLVDGLLGYRKGWLVYSPLVGLGVLGLVLMLLDRESRPKAWPVLLFLTVMCYVVFSWQQWWYGGSFGSRPMVSSLALLALPTAYLSSRVFTRHWMLRGLLIILLAGGIKLNMFQQNQYRRGIIHWDAMTKEQYWEVFGKTDTSGARLAP